MTFAKGVKTSIFGFLMRAWQIARRVSLLSLFGPWSHWLVTDKSA